MTTEDKTQVSIHNSRKELEVTPELIEEIGFEPHIHKVTGIGGLPYRQYVSGSELPGDYALLIFLHGMGSVGDDNFLQTRIPGPPIADYCSRHKIKAVVLLPQCPVDYKWCEVPYDTASHDMPKEQSIHMKLALSLLESKMNEFQVDRKRIYASGVSMGGFGAWDMICRKPDLFAAALTICGGADTKQAAKLKDIAILNVHGECDNVVLTSRSRDIVAALKEASNNQVVYKELPGVAHNAWDWVFGADEALDWLFKQTK